MGRRKKHGFAKAKSALMQLQGVGAMIQHFAEQGSAIIERIEAAAEELSPDADEATDDDSEESGDEH